MKSVLCLSLVCWIPVADCIRQNARRTGNGKTILEQTLKPVEARQLEQVSKKEAGSYQEQNLENDHDPDTLNQDELVLVNKLILAIGVDLNGMRVPDSLKPLLYNSFFSSW